ncbi:MAG: hypothetical protein CM15mP62_27250 [Rhodospirillaceae bacterium]|nr:MAG: hypothetical protein CM15mP62_27250 [Rhodospirillaceae bacterium]
MKRDWAVGSEIETTLRVDGGLAANNWAMQFLADILMSTSIAQLISKRPPLEQLTSLVSIWRLCRLLKNLKQDGLENDVSSLQCHLRSVTENIKVGVSSPANID